MRRARLRRNVMQNNVTQTIESTGKPPHRIETAADGERLIRHLADVLEALLGIVEEETELVRAGRISRAAKLETRKAELCGLYLGAAERLKANSAFLGANLLALQTRQQLSTTALSLATQSDQNVLRLFR